MNMRALVVDDDELMARTLSDVLRYKGWNVTTAGSGGAAVNEVVRGDFDVVLMDYKMPGMDGVTAVKAMKQVRPRLSVVLMSGFLAPEVVDEAVRNGVRHVLAKPVNVGALLMLLADTP